MLRGRLGTGARILIAFLLSCRPEIKDAVLDVDGSPVDPLSSNVRATVFVFTRSDCPIANRYSPELRRLYDAYAGEGVRFWIVYPDPRENVDAIRQHRREFDLPFEALRDPDQILVRKSGATISPEAAVFDGAGRLVYRGRIDDRFPELGISRPPLVRDLDAALARVVSGETMELTTTPAAGCYLGDLR